MDKQILKSLGKAVDVAPALGVTPQALSNWGRTGIPAHARPDVLRLARAHNIPIDPADFIGVDGLGWVEEPKKVRSSFSGAGAAGPLCAGSISDKMSSPRGV